MSNFWNVYKHAGQIDVVYGIDARGEPFETTLDLCRDRHGRLGIVYAGPAYSPHAGELIATFGDDDRGFVSTFDAQCYADQHPPVVSWR